MRIRSTKPEFWRSERICSVSWDARLVLKGLESYVDDNGVGKDDLALIVADVFPRDLSRNPTGTLQKVSEALDRLSEAGLLWRYEAAGTRLLYIAFWESVQRIEKPTRGRFPRPDGTVNYRESEIGEASGRGPGSLPEASGLEQGNRGTGEQGKEISSPVAPSTPRPASGATSKEFSEWWAHYPRKVGKKAAEKSYSKARRDVSAAKLLAAVARFARDPNLPEKEFIPHPATWLNEGRWDDEPLPPRNVVQMPRNGPPDLPPEVAEDMRRNPWKYSRG
jgi:hypothetical protein